MENIESTLRASVFRWLISWCLQRNHMQDWRAVCGFIWIMTLSFSSFSINDILTTRHDVRGKPGAAGSTAEPGRNACAGHGGSQDKDTRVHVLSHQDVDGNRVRRLELSVSTRNPRPDTYSEESTGEETEHLEGQWILISFCLLLTHSIWFSILFYSNCSCWRKVNTSDPCNFLFLTNFNVNI